MNIDSYSLAGLALRNLLFINTKGCNIVSPCHYILHPMQPSSLPTVWVVDDDEDDQLFIRNAFADSEPSVSVLSLTDGADLLSKLANCVKLPQLILLDVNMPVKNGFEALAELRSTPEFANLPVVMLTTSSAEHDRKRAYALGANQFLTKPLSFDQLQTMAQELSQRWVLI